jgi:hypothetical protein
MRMYWTIMATLLLLPWALVLVPPAVAAVRRTSGAGRRCGHLRWVRTAVLIAVLFHPMVAVAGEAVVTPTERLRDGARDLATGWTAFFRTLAAETDGRGPVTGVWVGSLEGANHALQQTLRGAYETTTFFLPVPRPQPTAGEPGTLLEVRF